MKKFIVITLLFFATFGCKNMKQTVMPVKGIAQNKSVVHSVQDSIETGVYLKDEGVLGFLWYVNMTKSPDDHLISQGYEFSFLNLSLFIITVFVILSIKCKKEVNIYAQEDALDVNHEVKQDKVISPSSSFHRGMRLFVLLTLATALIFTYCVVASDHIVITPTIALSNIIVSMVIYALFIYGYWYFILKYTDIYIKQSIDHDDIVVSSKYGALILAVLLVVILTWFSVIGILSGLFIPLLGVIGAIILILILKERTGFIRVLFSLYYNIKYFIFGSLSGD